MSRPQMVRKDWAEAEIARLESERDEALEMAAAAADDTKDYMDMTQRLKQAEARVAKLEAALWEYANPLNWTLLDGIRRIWLEPGSATPEAYNGFELARAALRGAGREGGE
jgi:hypothetical protein